MSHLKFPEYCPNASLSSNICHNFKLVEKRSMKKDKINGYGPYVLIYNSFCPMSTHKAQKKD